MKMAKKFLLILSIVALMVASVSIAAFAAPGDGNGAWTLVTDASTLQAGDTIVIVATKANYALSTNQKSNNRGAAAITKNADSTVTIGSDVQQITLEAGTASGSFAFKAGTQYLYAASTSSNHLKSKSTKDASGSWNITISDGVATIKSVGNTSKGWMRYNPNNGTPLFSCYASGQNDISIYRWEESTSADPNEAIAKEAVNSLNVSGIFAENGTLTLPTSATVEGNVVAISWSIATAPATGSATLDGNVLTYTMPEAGEGNGIIILEATASIGEATASGKFNIELVAPIKTITIPEALEIGKDYTNNQESPSKYYVIGTITSIANTTYGNVYIEDELGNEIYVYGLYSDDGTVRFDKMDPQPKVGDTVKLLSVVSYYNSAPQLKNAWLIEYVVDEGDDELTPDEQVQYEANQITIPSKVTQAATVEVPFYGATYYDVYMTWESDSEYVVFDDGEETITYILPEAGAEDVVVTLTATIAMEGAQTITKTYTVTLVAPIKTYVPVEGIGYKFAMLQTSKGELYYNTGAMNGYYMATTTDADSAAIVYIENTDGGFYMYTIVNGAKKYMNMTVSGTHINATYDDEPKSVFTYSTTINGPVTDVDGTEYGYGTYGTYTTIGTNKTSNAGSANNYFCQFVEVVNPISFEGAALNINSNIDMMYYVAINGEATDVSATFKFCGKTTTVTEYTIGEDGRYCFVFKGITPDLMGVNVEITVSATYGEASFTATDNSMSVRTYYEIAKEYCAEDTKLLTLMSDVLVYGAAVQTWIGDNEDELVTYGLELTPSTTEFVAPETMLEVYGESFKSATLVLGSTITVRFTVAAEEDAVIRVALNEKVAEYNVADLAKDAEGNYIVEFKNVYASECDNAIWASIVGTDECVRYSVNSYISEMANADDADLVALVKALYTYGVTADAYN